MKVLFCIVPAQGHLNPIVPLARAFQDRGHDVRIGTAASFGDAVHAAGLNAIPIGLDLDGRDPSATHPEFLTLSPLDQARLLLRLMGAPIADDLVEFARTWRPDVIVRDNATIGAWAAGEELRIPVVVFGSTGVTPRPALKRMVGDVLAELRANRGLTTKPDLDGFHGVMCLDTTPPSLVSPSSGEVEGRRPLRPDQWVGAGDSPVPAWLDSLGGRPIVYVTLGTVVNTRLVFQKIIEAASGLELDAVVTTGRQDIDFSAVPSNVHVAPYIPQDRVLTKASAVVCHAGRGTVYGALAQGLPLCLIPLGADQPVVAAACERAGVGLVCATTTTNYGPVPVPIALPADLDPRSIRESLVALLGSAGPRKRALEVADEIAAMPSPPEVAASIDALLSVIGASSWQ